MSYYNSTEEYIERMIVEGYIDSRTYAPLKCSCGSKNLEEYNEYYEEHTLVEFSVKCKTCGKEVGHWAYGGYDI